MSREFLKSQTSNTSKKQAKELLHQCRHGDAAAIDRFSSLVSFPRLRV